ncbi:MAG: tRNA pseudouridine(38-40) synthase TruA [Thermodesulfobacteriota bacterium]
MRNIKLTIEYDGTNYLGWQKQPRGSTVQEEIEKALNNMTGESIALLGSGRTDSGVHAFAQVASFKTNSNIKSIEFQMGLNSSLPIDITIREAIDVGTDFHAQFSAKSKKYIYKIFNSPHPSALLRKRVWFMPLELDINKMKEAAEYLIGEHDFKAFAQSGIEVKTTVRNVLNVSLEQKDNNIILFSIESTGFLKRMVRLIIGTLVQVGKEKITPLDFSNILESGEKTKFVYAAPPQGLYLKEVKY